jgi:hypothetical protein
MQKRQLLEQKVLQDEQAPQYLRGEFGHRFLFQLPEQD